MNIAITTDMEAEESIDARKLDAETRTECVARHAQAMVDGWVQADIQASGAALTAACLSLPKSDRDDVIAFIEAKLSA